MRQDMVLATKVDSMAVMKKILRRIGFRPVSKYARHHTTWEVGGTKVSISEFLFGTYLEISGEAEHMLHLMEKFGLTLKDSITAPYEELHRDYRLQKVAAKTQLS